MRAKKRILSSGAPDVKNKGALKNQGIHFSSRVGDAK
jgi:hypothetical protein